DREVVELTRLRIVLAVRLHREPRVVDHRARMGRTGDLDRRTERERARIAAVGLRVATGARAVRRLADEDVRSVGEHEVGRALRASSERLYSRMNRGSRGR